MQPPEEVVPFASGPPEQVSSCAHAAVTASDTWPTGSADSADADPVGDPALQPAASTSATAHNMPIPPKTPRVVNFIFPPRSGAET
jgi:hypothetical protein